MKIEIIKSNDRYERDVYFEHRYVDGIKHGLQKAFRSNGQRYGEFNYKNGIIYGISQYWYIDNSRNHITQWKRLRINGLDIKFKYYKNNF
jgi:antitoxin component YwqK of YwqJK toxin-antitoxin module